MIERILVIKLLIVDDETIVREGIRYSIEKNFDTITIVGESKNGLEAIEAVEQFRPDIVLMDIQMPGLNGLETIKRIKRIDTQIKFIIVSAFEQFEYAKEALKMGVKDYISKPVLDYKLLDVLNRMMDEIEIEARKKQESRMTQDKLDRMGPVLESGFIYAMLLNVDPIKSSSTFGDHLNLKGMMGYVMIIDFIEDDNNKTVENNNKLQSIRNLIKYKCDAIVGPMMVNRMIIVVKSNNGEDQYQERLKTIDLAENIYKSLSNMLSCELNIGIGSHQSVNRLNQSFLDAKKALRKMTTEKVLHIEDISPIKPSVSGYSFADIKSDEERILELIEEGRTGDVNEKLDRFFKKLRKTYSEDTSVIRNVAMELMVIINMLSYRNDLDESCRYNQGYLDEVRNTEEILDLKNKIIQKTIHITETISNEKSHKASQIIINAVEFIKENYHNDIRLKDVAASVCISPHYFSKIFKDELAVNFIDFLTGQRMEQAKKLLKQNEFTIKYIAYSVGYNDPNYFSRLFKKVVGMSPKEYQRCK